VSLRRIATAHHECAQNLTTVDFEWYDK